MATIPESLHRLAQIGGALGAALVDFESGMCLGTIGIPGFDMELAAAGNTEVVRANKNIRDRLGIRDRIEDILITLATQYHLIRMAGTSMFLYVVLDREKANLALARIELASVERALDVQRA